MKYALLATTAFTLIAAHASAVDVELYGQVNKGLFALDDGQDTNVTVTDNNYSSTRFGFKGAQALDNGLTASVLFEGEMASNPSNLQTQSSASGSTGTSTTPGSNTPTFAERQARVGLSGNFGGLYIGQQSTAIDNVSMVDLAGAQDVLGSDYRRIGGAYQFRNSSNGAINAGLTTNALTYTLGTTRADSVRYDSPIFYGVQGRASVSQGGDSELSAFYDNTYGEFKIKGAAGIQFVNSATTVATNAVDQNYAATLSIAHSSGLAATLTYTGQGLQNKTANAHEAEGWYGKVGYAWDKYEVAADYGNSQHFGSAGFPTATLNTATLETYGLAAQYNVAKGVSVAALYRNLDADVTGRSLESIDLYGVNMRVKF